MTDYLLTPPTVDEGFGQYERLTDPLWRYMQMEVAQSVVKLDGTWLVARIGSYSDLSVLDAYYQGGSVYTVDQATRDDMVADGLGAYLTAIGEADYSTEILADAPFIWWRLGDAPGSVIAEDSSGNETDGVLDDANSASVASLISDVSNDARLYDGPGGVTPLALVSASPGPWAAGTVECWLETTDSAAVVACVGGAGAGGDLLIVLSGFPSAGDLSAYVATVETPGSPILVTVTAAGHDDGSAHHVVVTAGSGVVSLYLDGAEIGTDTYPVDEGFDFATLSAGESQAGAAVFTLDEVAFYDTALSAGRVLAHYTAGVA